MAKEKIRVAWADALAEHDYPAAAAYLELVAGPNLVEVLTADHAQVRSYGRTRI